MGGDWKHLVCIQQQGLRARLLLQTESAGHTCCNRPTLPTFPQGLLRTSHCVILVLRFQ